MYVLLLGVLLVLYAIRCMILMHEVFTMRRPPSNMRNADRPVKTLLVIGSGGHTAELLKISQFLNVARYRPRIYVMADTDINSEMKIISVEYNNPKGDYIVTKIPRSRTVGQSYVTSVFTTIWSIICSIPPMLYHRPELILCNGPGTCIPICLIAFLMRAAYINDNRIIFFESVCRVKSLSLSGKILLFFADNIFVQWPELAQRYWRTQYIGTSLTIRFNISWRAYCPGLTMEGEKETRVGPIQTVISKP